ncbi:MAG: hypothetical protein JW801_19500 [Bacteroidales bacterium]|nr:hypothetical protein [Bacteroidales bacterium]
MEGKCLIRIVLLLVFLYGTCLLYGQHGSKENEPVRDAEKPTVRLTNSESPDISFLVETNLKDCSIYLQTNYPESFKLRIFDYWGETIKVYRNLNSGQLLDISEFKGQIVILNIYDSKSNRLLTSQVMNLKRRNYWESPKAN